MLKKIAIFLIVVMFPVFSNAQLINFSKKSPPKVSKVLVEDDSAKQDKSLQPQEEQELSEEDKQEEPPPPTTVTPSQRAEIETNSKKRIRIGVKAQNLKYRKNLINAMTWSEKNMKIRELMKQGKSYKEAQKEVNELIKTPDIDLNKNKEIEKYIYKKGQFITDGD